MELCLAEAAVIVVIAKIRKYVTSALILREINNPVPPFDYCFSDWDRRDLFAATGVCVNKIKRVLSNQRIIDSGDNWRHVLDDLCKEKELTNHELFVMRLAFKPMLISELDNLEEEKEKENPGLGLENEVKEDEEKRPLIEVKMKKEKKRIQSQVTPEVTEFRKKLRSFKG